MRAFWKYIVDAVHSPREELTRQQHRVRYAWELTFYCGKQLLFHRAEGMAAELTYRTIFALIPVVALGLVLFRVVGGLDTFHEQVENRLYSFFGVPEIPEDYVTPVVVDQVDPLPETEPSADDALVPGAPDEQPQPPLKPPEPSQLDDDADGDRPPLGGEADGAGEALADRGEAAQGVRPEDDLVTGGSAASGETGAVAKEASEQEAENRRQARASIRRSLRDITSKIASLDFASIGVLGLLLFIYAAIALADSTEYLFNRIYDAPSQRPIHIRIAIHWSIITLGSGLLAISLYLSGRVVEWLGGLGAGATLMWLLGHLLSILASWVLLFLLYALMPNTHVSLRAAAIGAVVGSSLWEAAKFGFQVYVIKLLPYSALYGSLGLIPLFLFWIYVTWLIVLFGLILTYTLQTLRGRRPTWNQYDEEQFPSGDPDWMLPIMTEVAHAFEQGGAIDRQELADRLGLSGRIVHDLANKLIDAGCLRRVSAGPVQEEELTLARPAEKIRVGEILDLAHRSRPTNNHPAWRLLSSLKRAEREAAGEQTLADLMAPLLRNLEAQKKPTETSPSPASAR